VVGAAVVLEGVGLAGELEVGVRVGVAVGAEVGVRVGVEVGPKGGVRVGLAVGEGDPNPIKWVLDLSQNVLLSLVDRDPVVQ
jgi:hypothetical protein